MMNQIPHEFVISGVYMSPWLIASLFGGMSALLTTNLLNRFNLSKYFFYPPLVLLALMIIYSILIGTFIIRA